ncbi:MAG TPA: hypothetical protein VEK38_02820 [Candidatus Bathyarchaeia archaeon]|nr:hypothetical protein [Candidatus Bathyarchaeia archaeon]
MCTQQNKQLFLLSIFISSHISADVGAFFSNVKNKISNTASSAKKYAGHGVNFVKSTTETSSILSMIKDINFSQSRWLELPDKMPLSKAVFLGTHNSFSTLPVFKIYNQHVLSIRQQLDYGVRGLMPDTYLFEGTVQLCHGGCSGAPAIFQAGSAHPPYQKFSTLLQEIYAWLVENPREIVFLFLENYAPEEELDASIEAVQPLLPLIVTTENWTQYGLDHGQDVTIGQLRHDNKRIMIFNSLPDTRWTMQQWDRVAENSYSTTDPQRLCLQRKESFSFKSLPRPLLLMNYFKEVTATMKDSMQMHTYDNISHAIDRCFTQFHNKTPNFIFIDRLESLGVIHKNHVLDVLDLINTLNSNTMQHIP